MASAQEVLNNGSSSPISYSEWRDQQVSNYYNTGNGWKDFWRGLTTWPKLLNSKNDADFGRKAYEDYVSNWERNYDYSLAEQEYARNKADVSAANKLTFAREDSQVQRLVEDYKKAGLNPYMILNGGNLSSGVVSSQAASPSYKRSSYKKSKSNDDESLKTVTSAIRAIALIAMLAG